MKLRYLGLILIIIGIITPFGIYRVFPNFLYGSAPSALLLWAGFLIVLCPIENNSNLNPYLKWARYGIVLNIVFTMLLVGYIYIVFYFKIKNNFAFYFMRFFTLLTNPVQVVFDFLVPKPMIHHADGSISVTTSFNRTLFTGFFNLVFYSISGIIVKKIKDLKITRVFSGS